MQAAQPCRDQLVGEPVVLGAALPAHPAEESNCQHSWPFHTILMVGRAADSGRRVNPAVGIMTAIPPAKLSSWRGRAASLAPQEAPGHVTSVAPWRAGNHRRRAAGSSRAFARHIADRLPRCPRRSPPDPPAHRGSPVAGLVGRAGAHQPAPRTPSPSPGARRAPGARRGLHESRVAGHPGQRGGSPGLRQRAGSGPRGVRAR